jgi:hypothetical protein
LRAGLAFRLTEQDGLRARSQSLVGSLGLAWTIRRYARPGAVGFGFRADLLGMRQAVRYAEDALGGTDEQTYLSLGADLLAEGGVGLSPETALVLAVGGETMFTAADLFLGATHAATLPRDRLILELGILARF